MKNILGSQASRGTVAGSSREQDVSNEIDMANNPPLEESSPALPINTADGTADSALYHLLVHTYIRSCQTLLVSLLKDLP
jgi:hypothetical protein